MKQLQKPPEQTPFVVILASQGRRYRNVILAYDVEEAREKAVQMAATLTGNFMVQDVRRAEARAPTENALAGGDGGGGSGIGPGGIGRGAGITLTRG